MEKNGFANIRSAFLERLKQRSELNLRNIRTNRLQYFFALVLSLALADMQLSYFHVEATLFHLNCSTLMQLAYCAAAASILMIKIKHLKWYGRVSTLVTLLGFAGWSFLPWSMGKLIAVTFCWAGLGGCAAGAVYAYAFVLQNAERFYGALLITLSQGLLLLAYYFNIRNAFLENILPTLIVAAITVCMCFFREADFPDISTPPAPQVPKGKYVILVCCGCFFTISVLGELLMRLYNLKNYRLYAVGIALSVVSTILLQFLFRRSVWHIWNLFLIGSVLSSPLMVFTQEGWALAVGAFLFGCASGAGYTIILYMGAGFVKKYASLKLFRQAMLATGGIAILPMVAAGIIVTYYPQVLYELAIGLTVFFLFIFLLFSPLFYQDLFRNDWMDEYHRRDMDREGDRFAGLGLTPREKEVCALLLEGYTLRQISGQLKIGYPTVNTYCTNLYRKLSINSRSELFALLGVSPVKLSRASSESSD